MHEILDHLPEGAAVLDLGSRNGSFPAADYPRLVVVRADIKPGPSGGRFVQADATSLPFASRSFDAVILNHSLEHFVKYKAALQEIGRVVKREGAVFVAVPDARTLADRIYRKVYVDAGGHVNLFDGDVELAKTLAWYFGLPHVATRVLCSSLVFLNRRNTRDRMVRKQLRLPAMGEPWLAALSGILRLVDRLFHTRASVYGWAFYFGSVPETVDPLPRTNVCVRCGQAHPSGWLVEGGLVRRQWPRVYKCPDCGATNWYTRDEDFTRLSEKRCPPRR